LWSKKRKPAETGGLKLSVLPVVLLCVGIGILIWGWRIPEPIKNSLKTIYRIYNIKEISPKHNVVDINQRGRSIPGKYSKVIELREQGYSNKEIAKKLKINQNSVRLMLMLYLKENKYEDNP
jgi:Sigma-70, region 4.